MTNNDTIQLTQVEAFLVGLCLQRARIQNADGYGIGFTFFAQLETLLPMFLPSSLLLDIPQEITDVPDDLVRVMEVEWYTMYISEKQPASLFSVERHTADEYPTAKDEEEAAILNEEPCGEKLNEFWKEQKFQPHGDWSLLDALTNELMPDMFMTPQRFAALWIARLSRNFLKTRASSTINDCWGEICTAFSTQSMKFAHRLHDNFDALEEKILKMLGDDETRQAFQTGRDLGEIVGHFDCIEIHDLMSTPNEDNRVINDYLSRAAERLKTLKLNPYLKSQSSAAFCLSRLLQHCKCYGRVQYEAYASGSYAQVELDPLHQYCWRLINHVVAQLEQIEPSFVGRPSKSGLRSPEEETSTDPSEYQRRLANAQRMLVTHEENNHDPIDVITSLAPLAEAMAKQVWPQHFEKGIGYSPTLTDRVRNGTHHERKFASLALHLNKYYRNTALHEPTDLAYSWNDAAWVISAVTMLSELQQTMTDPA
jgi:hypothetical protein